MIKRFSFLSFFPTGKCVGLKYLNISENLLDDLPAHILKSTLSCDFI